MRSAFNKRQGSPDLAYVIEAVHWIMDSLYLDILPRLARIETELQLLPIINQKVTRMDSRVQEVLDAIADNKSAAESTEAGIQEILSQVQGLKQQVTDLQAQIAAGSPVSEDDLNQLATAAKTLEATTVGLRTAIPQGTEMESGEGSGQ